MQETWNAYQKTKSKDLKDNLVIQYLPLIKYVIGKFQLKISNNLEYDDLLNIGVIGLMEAVEKFNPEFSVKFETYALARIKGAIIDKLREEDIFSRSARKKLKEVEAAYIYLERKFKRPPEEKEVAAHLKLTREEFYKLLNKIAPVTVLSLDEKSGERDAPETIFLKDIVEDTKSPNPQKIIEEKEIKGILRELIYHLKDIEKKILFLYYYEDLTLKEISLSMDISESRVCQIHSTIVIKLRAKIREYLGG